MTAQKGRNMLLKVKPDGSTSFATVAGLRARTIAFNAATVDITNADSTGAWRELLAGAGVKTARFSGTGLFRDSTADETVRGIFFAAAIHDWQVVIPDFGAVEGAFQITALEYAGEFDGEISYQISLESAGSVTFTAD